MMGSQLTPYFKARTLFQPFHGLHHTVAVAVGAEVAVTAEAGVAELHQQPGDQQTEGRALLWGAGVLGATVGVETAFVADADGILVVAFHMGAGTLQGAGEVDGAVTTKVVVIARAVVAAAEVVGF